MDVPLYFYFPIAKPVFLRASLELGYSQHQPEMPASLRVEEKEWRFGKVSVWFMIGLSCLLLR